LLNNGIHILRVRVRCSRSAKTHFSRSNACHWFAAYSGDSPCFVRAGCRVIFVYFDCDGIHSDSNSRLRCLVHLPSHCSCSLPMQHSSRGTWRRGPRSTNAMRPALFAIPQRTVLGDRFALDFFCFAFETLSVIFAFLCTEGRHLVFADSRVTFIARGC
jgi:hypothetical protein